MNRVERNLAALSVRAVALACCLVLGAAANAAAAPPTPAAPPANPMPPDDPAKVAAAVEFIHLYHPNTDPKKISQIIDSFMPRAIAAAKRKDPKLDEKKFDQDKRAHMMENAEKGVQRQAHVVSRHFTLQELKDLIAFFRGPLGHKLTTEAPKITQELKLTKPLFAPKIMIPSPPKPPAKPHK